MSRDIQDTEVRCGNCNRLLAEAADNADFTCPRCHSSVAVRNGAVEGQKAAPEGARLAPKWPEKPTE
jgi:predicted RNA-binding Zn-ribbon protein involved in translation (DUF1610 family)